MDRPTELGQIVIIVIAPSVVSNDDLPIAAQWRLLPAPIKVMYGLLILFVPIYIALTNILIGCIIKDEK